MKITKTTIGVFLLTFLIGYVLVPQTKQISNEISIDVPKISLVQPIETKIEQEVIEEIDGWIDEDKYPFKIKLLTTGEGFHGDEVEARSGETWLGLFNENGKHFLRFTKIKIRRVHDDIVDEDKRKKTGKNVSVESRNKPVFLLKNANMLREGEVTTLFRGLTWNEVLEDVESTLSPDEMLTRLKKDFFQKYEIGGKKHELKVIEAKNKKDEKILALILESEGTKQILYTTRVDYHNPDLGTLYWVGDLDRDGKPDFYLSLFVHDNVGNQVLFLSSKADKGKLVKKAAYFWTTGC